MRKKDILFGVLNLLIFKHFFVQGSTDATFPVNCTVLNFTANTTYVESEEDQTVQDMLLNQIDFHNRCGHKCISELVRDVVRVRCSEKKKISSASYAVYQCPKNQSSYYVMAYDRCYLKHYTLCNDSITANNTDLISHVSDLFCGCAEDLQPDVNTRKCDKDQDSAYIYCKVAPKSGRTYPFIARREKCSGGTCKYDEDTRNKTMCSVRDENNIPIYGKYCNTTMDKVFNRTKFVKKSRLCDGDFDCDNDGDRVDEHNCLSEVKEPVGLYCDRNATNPEHYVKCSSYIGCKVCNGRIDCDKNSTEITNYEYGLDESEEKCPDVYCKSKAENKTITVKTSMMCDANTDCIDAKDENFDYCVENADMNKDDGASCDNNTKWVKQKYLCTGRNLCTDGMDNDTSRWNCGAHETCPATKEGGPKEDYILCNSTLFCNLVTTVSNNCNYCPSGTANAVERCNTSANGIICTIFDIYTMTNIEKFVYKSDLCDGDPTCLDGSDNQGCENGYYCGTKFISWKDICTKTDEKSADCADKSDYTGCSNSPFFDEIVTNSKGIYTLKDLFNNTLIENNTVFEDKYYARLAQHRVFTCEDHLLDTTGDKGALIKNVTDTLCLPLEKFSCKKKYTTLFNSSERIHRDWLCDDIVDCENGNDEDNSLVFKCTRTRKRCYTKQMRCDGTDDCGDDSDEVGCSNEGLRCRDYSDPKNDTFVEDKFICDGYEDCVNGMDESICGHKSSIKGEVIEKDGDKVTLYRTLVYGNQSNLVLKEKKFTRPAKIDCKGLNGGDYITAVYHTQPTEEDDNACSNHSIYNNALFNGIDIEWYQRTYGTAGFDKQCEGEQVFYPEMQNSSIDYQTFVKFTEEGGYLDTSFYCKNNETRKEPGACGIAIDKLCNFENDCGDWSDENKDTCVNNFLCKNPDNSTAKAIHISKRCDGISSCISAQDECLEICNLGFLTNINKILGTNPALLVVVWIFGVISLVFNFYVIVTMAKSAFQVLHTIPHRFIYRSLVTTIAIGDIFVSIYLVILASVDTFRQEKYCEVKEEWLTGITCTTMGVISTFGNHVSLFAMMTLSLFRLKTVVHYMWPRTVNAARAIRLSAILITVILGTAILLSIIPIIDAFKDSFIDKFYFPAPTGNDLFGKGDKEGVSQIIQAYIDVLPNTTFPVLTALNNTINKTRSWDDIFEVTNLMFNSSDIIDNRKRYNIYSSHGVCLFNYLGLYGDLNFGYVIFVIATNLLCFLAIIMTYVVIWKIGTKSKSTEKKLQKKLSLAIALCIICRLPLFMMCIYHAIHGSLKSSVETSASAATSYRILSVFIIPINSVINPFINSEPSILDLLFRRAKDVAEMTMTMSHAPHGQTNVTVAATTNTLASNTTVSKL